MNYEASLGPYKDNKSGFIKNVIILGHSAAGWRVSNLLDIKGKKLIDYVRCVAFTDVHKQQQYMKKNSLIKQLYNKAAKNWVSGYVLDKLVSGTKNNSEVEMVGAGHKQHIYTSASAFPSVVSFMEEKINSMA